MTHQPLAALLLLLASGVSHADNCESIAAQIEARMRTGGLAPNLVTLDKGATIGGRVVGSCASGSKQIVQLPGSAASGLRPALRPVPADNILTECKDGRVVRGPDCSRPAPPPPRASAASAPA